MAALAACQHMGSHLSMLPFVLWQAIALHLIGRMQHCMAVRWSHSQVWAIPGQSWLPGIAWLGLAG